MEYLSHIDLVTDNKVSTKNFQKLEDSPLDEIDVNCMDLFRFYGMSHSGAAIVLIVLLLIPPLIDLYMEVIVAESVHSSDATVHATEHDIEEKHYLTLRFGVAVLVFIVMNLIKILFFANYIRLSGYKIVKNVVKSFLLSKVENTLNISNRKSALDL